jgi:hypothetical protein
MNPGTHTPARLPAAACAALLLGLAGAARAQDAPGLEQRGWLQLGALDTRFKSEVRIDSTNGSAIGSDVRLEADLGLPEHKTVARVLAGLRLGQAWRVEGEVLTLRRQGRAQLTADIVVEDTTYAAAGQVDSRFDSSIARLALGWSFHRSDTSELGLALGLHITDFRLKLAGVASVNGTQVGQRSVEKSQAVPLPALGAFGALALAPGWRVAGRIDALSLNSRGYKGQLTNAEVQVLYHPTALFGLGLGYRLVDYRVDADTKQFSGRVDYKFSGPQATLDLQF